MSNIEKEAERLRDFRGRIARVLGQSPSDCDDLLILGLDAAIKISKRQAARIKELEAVLADMSRRAERLLVTVTEDEAYRNRLEVAFLEEYQRGAVMLSPNAAQEALEKIRSGKDE